MLWVVTHIDNKFFFDAEEDTDVRIAPPESMVAFLQSHPNVTFGLLGKVYIKVDKLLDRMMNLMTGSALKRVLYELMAECKEFGQNNTDGSCTITLNEHDIAMRAGLSRETVSRELKKITHEDIVHVARSGILIKSTKRLQAKLESVT